MRPARESPRGLRFLLIEVVGDDADQATRVGRQQRDVVDGRELRGAGNREAVLRDRRILARERSAGVVRGDREASGTEHRDRHGLHERQRSRLAARQPRRPLRGWPGGSPPLLGNVSEPDRQRAGASRLGPRYRPVATIDRRERQQESVAAQHTKRQARRGVGLTGRRREEAGEQRHDGEQAQQQPGGVRSRFSISTKTFVENRDLTPRSARATHDARSAVYGLSRTSRTFFKRSSREKGFARKSDDRSGSRLPGYPEMHRSFSERRRPRR